MAFSQSEHDFFELLKGDINGCPICSLEEERVKRSMKVLLYESITKRQFRKDIRFSRICRKHYDMFNQSVKEDLTVAGLGPAIIFWDMIKSQSEEMDKNPLFKKRQKSQDCYFCSYLETLPERITQSAYNVLKDPKGTKSFKDTQAVVCFDHFERLLKVAGKNKDKAFIHTIQPIQKAKLERLTDQLRQFIDKHDYANHVKITQEEALSLKIAFQTLLKI
ncbi:MAG: hypothetical protein PWQ84_705 [Thermotogaceae bacterium]|jgi:hypothetical protein|nr:hypothetical protein [Thermotogaceae bacterium]